ncbi:MAG TPA: DinB family protein [Verrucomicrobiae bacterium]|nr:DinB family protein [Verrucomicrobiae bacterium]
MNESPQQYTQRMVGHLEGKDPLKLQATAPDRFARMIRNTPASLLRKSPAPGKWSIAEILAHLADTEIVVGYRLRSILGAPGTPLPGFNQDAWAATMEYSNRKPQDSLRHFRAIREANLALLKRIKPEQWKHFGVHSERGEESIEFIVRLIAGHDLNHGAQIEAILNSGKKSRKAKRK